ncbi:MAG: DNA-protecting protein DprA, partial [Clostridiales bacterium]|nr:DNA-protecting protein DprA [Clostridiales bacterium]
MTRAEWLALWLHYGVNAQVKPFAEISGMFSSLEEAYDNAAKRESSAFAGVADEVRARLFEAADARFMARYTGWLEKHEVGITTLDSDDYPALLREIPDPPPLLFYRGRLVAEPVCPVAVIGARACTGYGKDVARTLGRQLAEHGATVVTGLAEGIDTHATLGALDCETNPYPTVGVLGCGIDVVFPQSNRLLYEALAERGAVVTEFLPRTQALAFHFPIRNRIMSGLSRGVVVVEAGARSG